MSKKRRTSRLATCTAAVMAVGAGVLAFTGSASAATYTATDTASFVAAVNTSNGNAGPNTINVSAASYTPGATVNITTPVTIQGPAPTATQSAAQAKFVGGAIVPTGGTLFNVKAGITVNFNDIAISNAGSTGNPAIDSFGTVNVNQSGIGGATGPGLAVESTGVGNVVNSTISDGLDIGVIDTGTLTLTNSTVARNATGGVDNGSGKLNLVNTIIAKNNGSKDCTAVALSSDHSLDSDGSCGVGALSAKDPLLGSIGIHGGTSPTDVPSSASPALDAGNTATCPTVDQRGASRNDSAEATCDIGAVESYYGVAPILTTANKTTGTTSASGTTVAYAPAWNAGAPIASSCSPASGSNFPVGSTTVTCTGTDATFSNSGTGTFTVTVVQATPPTVTTSGSKTVAAVDATGATATFTASANDSIDGPIPATCTPASGSKFPLGPTTVTCSATNSNGQTGTATLVITVADQTPPVITVPASFTVVASGATAVNYTATAKDNVDTTVTPTCVPASGSTFQPGPTTVTCNAKDAAGNAATPATFTVTVSTTSPSSSQSSVQGEVPNGGSPGGLQITAKTCEFGPVFIPGLAGTYGCTADVSVTSTDSTTTLTINDVSTKTNAGHLVNPVGPVSLATAALDKATTTAPGATGPGFTALTGSAATLLNYIHPVTSDPVTLAFQQAITATEPLTNGTYGATVLLQLSGTP